MSKKSPPSDLSAAGRSLWVGIADKYELRPDELATLHGAARAADMIDLLREAWSEAGCPTLTKGSMGQEIIHPMIGELRTQQAQQAALLARLKLPDLDEGAPANQNRDAAQASWKPGVRGA